jgi:hypothetical protein
MENPTEEEITRRAYELWEQAGKPDKADEFYYQAEQELRKKNKSSPEADLL